jgi:hypothetical protein
LEEAKKQKVDIIKANKEESAQEDKVFSDENGGSCVANIVLGEPLKNVEIIVELSSDTTILEKIHALLNEHTGERKAVLRIIARDMSVDIPLNSGVSEVFIDKLGQMDNVRVEL